MNDDQKLKLARAKAKQTPDMKFEVNFDSAEMTKVYEQLVATQDTIIKLVEAHTGVEANAKLVELNNSLVRLIGKVELSNHTIQKGLQDADLDKRELVTAIVKAVGAIHIPAPTQIPEWLKDAKAIDQLRADTISIGAQIAGLPEALKPGQQPGDFMPFRRVYKQGNILKFDDSTWSGGGGGGTMVTVAHNPWQRTLVLAQKATTTIVSASGGTFGGYMISNDNSVRVFLQIFDTTGAVTVGATVPDIVLGVPETSSANVEFTNGIKINSGIKVACTTTASGSTPPTNGLDMTILYE